MPVPMVQLDCAKPSSVELEEAVKLRVMWQVARRRSILVCAAVRGQSLD